MKEARQKQPHIIPFYLCEMSRISKSTETESKLVVIQGWEWEQGLTVNGHKEVYKGDGNVLKLDYGHSCTT